jgi:hypothetical protein
MHRSPLLTERPGPAVMFLSAMFLSVSVASRPRMGDGGRKSDVRSQPRDSGRTSPAPPFPGPHTPHRPITSSPHRAGVPPTLHPPHVNTLIQ